jgi:hypothetical protein
MNEEYLTRDNFHIWLSKSKTVKSFFQLNSNYLFVLLRTEKRIQKSNILPINVEM